MNQTTIFHLNYLETEYAKRTQSNPHYSLRSFARDLNVTVSWLSDFLNSKKGMSQATAEKICRSLSLNPTECELFLLSVRATHSRRPQDRKIAKAELKAYKVVEAFKMRPADFIETGAWYHQTILELTELEDFKHTETDIAQRLRLPLPTIKRAIEALMGSGLLRMEKGRMKACFLETESSMDTPSLAIRKYHEQILQKGTAALNEQSIESREFISATFAFDSGRVKEAKKALRQFRKKFTDEFYTQSEPKDSVYQLSLQFFRMDQKVK